MTRAATDAALQRLDIDWTRCDGHGLCAALAPQRIGRDEWGYPLVLDGPITPDELRDLRRAVSACPALALRITHHGKDS